MKKINIFTFLMIVTVFALVLRVLDISNFSTPHSIAEQSKSLEQVSSEDDFKSEGRSLAGHEAVSNNNRPDGGVDAEDSAPAQGESPYAEPSFTKAEADVLQQLAKRRDILDNREGEVKKKEALLKAAEQEVDKKISELDRIKKQLEMLLKDQKTIAAERVDSLVKIYEGMNPKKAAKIFDALDMDILMVVVPKMSERKSSPILANMNPDKARDITSKLALQYKLPDSD